MSKSHARILTTLNRYLENINYYISLADLADDEYHRIANPRPYKNRVSKSTLLAWRDKLTALIDEVTRREEIRDTVFSDMLERMESITGIAVAQTYEKYGPLIERGGKQLASGLKAHEATYGSKLEREREYRKWQSFIDSEYSDNPMKTYGMLIYEAARKFGAGRSTVEKHTKNPKKKAKKNPP